MHSEGIQDQRLVHTQYKESKTLDEKALGCFDAMAGRVNDRSGWERGRVLIYEST